MLTLLILDEKSATPCVQELRNSRYPGQGNEATGKASLPIDVGDAKKKRSLSTTNGQGSYRVGSGRRPNESMMQPAAIRWVLRKMSINQRRDEQTGVANLVPSSLGTNYGNHADTRLAQTLCFR